MVHLTLVVQAKNVGMALTTEARHQTNVIKLSYSAVRVIIFFLRFVLIVARQSNSFIKVGVAYVYRGI